MILILIGILGLCYGSFINVLVYRIPNNISIIFPGSFCPKCKNSIPFYRNIPILSYFIQLAKCHNCKDKISIQYPLVELITSLSWIYFYINMNNDTIELTFSILMISFLIPLALIDLKHMFFPISLIMPLIFLSITFSLIQFYYFDNFESLLGAAISIAFLSSTYLLVKLWFKYKNSKKTPMGFGDFLLIIPLGIWVGPLGILISIFLASLIALLVWIILNSLNLFELGKKMPFGPYLVISTTLIKALDITNLIPGVIFQIV